MRLVFYQAYIGQPPEQENKILSFARKANHLSIGIDTNFYPVCTYQSGRSFRQQCKFTFDFLVSYTKWYCNNLSNKRFIVPLGLCVGFIDSLSLFRKSFPIQERTMASFYKNNPTKINSEIMATYIRHVSSLTEEYGINEFTPWLIRRFMFRYRIYYFALKVLFALKPKQYVTWQGGYLQFFLPCQIAVDNKIPVAYLGSADGVPLRISCNDVWCDCEWPPNSISLLNPIPSLRKRDEARIQAARVMNSRLAGNKIDSLITYMPQNPYSKATASFTLSAADPLKGANLKIILPQRKDLPNGFVVVYMHEFNDYHHNGVLPNFASSYYEWFLITCKILEEAQIPYFVKVHPQLLLRPDTEIFQRSLLSLKLISSRFESPIPIVAEMTSTELVEEGMSVGCTVRGTVATELVHQKCPVICSGQPPYMNFMPSRIFNTYSSYSAALINYHKHAPVTQDEYLSNLDYLALSLRLISPHDL